MHFGLRPGFVVLAVLTGLGVRAWPQEAASLQFKSGTFIIRESGQTLQVPAVSGKAQADRAVYRKDANYAVWDSRGLTIRKGDSVRTSRLPDVSLSPKLFSTDEIIANRDLIAMGTRSKGADALSGSRRIADKAYFLLRWDSKYGETWLEALVEVDLDSADLHAKLLGKFDGVSTADHQVDDLLFSDPGYLRVITKNVDRSWGIASYDLAAGRFLFKNMGQNLLFSWRLGPQTALVEERTPYESKTLTRVDVINGARRTLREFQGSASVISDGEPVVLLLQRPSGNLLQNLDSSAEMAVSKSDVATMAGGLVVVWPQDAPSKAVLYDPRRWTPLAKAEGSESSSRPAALTSRSRTPPRRRAQP